MLISIDIYSEAFEQLRDDFNAVLARTIATMMDKDSHEASLTVKLNIGLNRFPIIDDSAPDGMRDTIQPEFSHKVSSVMQIKQEEQGKTKQPYEPVWDKVRHEFGMRPIGAEQLKL